MRPRDRLRQPCRARSMKHHQRVIPSLLKSLRVRENGIGLAEKLSHLRNLEDFQFGGCEDWLDEWWLWVGSHENFAVCELEEILVGGNAVSWGGQEHLWLWI